MIDRSVRPAGTEVLPAAAPAKLLPDRELVMPATDFPDWEPRIGERAGTGSGAMCGSILRPGLDMSPKSRLRHGADPYSRSGTGVAARRPSPRMRASRRPGIPALVSASCPTRGRSRARQSVAPTTWPATERHTQASRWLRRVGTRRPIAAHCDVPKPVDGQVISPDHRQGDRHGDSIARC
jgi:hypothetical protein